MGGICLGFNMELCVFETLGTRHQIFSCDYKIILKLTYAPQARMILSLQILLLNASTLIVKKNILFVNWLPVVPVKRSGHWYCMEKYRAPF